jgi:membrane protease YdiL (CAAX protease family)
LAFAGRKFDLWTISVSCALLFGAMHILVALQDVPLGYAIRLVVVGSAFGLVFPYLILRMRNGLAYAYIAHWSYYAVTALAPHVFYVPGSAADPG